MHVNFSRSSILVLPPQLNSDVSHFLVDIHQLVAHLHSEPECEIGLLDGSENFGWVDVAASKQLLDGLVGIELHRVDLLDRVDQDILKRRSTGLSGIDRRVRN